MIKPSMIDTDFMRLRTNDSNGVDLIQLPWIGPFTTFEQYSPQLDDVETTGRLPTA